MKKIKIKKKVVRYAIVILLLIALIFISQPLFKRGDVKIKKGDGYVASYETKAKLYGLDYSEVDVIDRGTLVTIDPKIITNPENNNKYVLIKHNKEEYLIASNLIVKNKEEVVLEKEIYVRTPATIYVNLVSSKILGFAKKGTKLEVTGFDTINSSGEVNKYKIKYEDKEGYIDGKYIEFKEEAALVHYDAENTYKVHEKRTNTWGGGSAGNLDFFPVSKPKFENNVMPEEVRSLYLNSGVLKRTDEYIELAKRANINAFVVDIKDNTSPGYESKVMEELSPTNYKYAHNTIEEYQTAIKKLKDAGFYVIGRITTFKDNYYIKDHPEDAIMNTSTNAPYLHDGANWPSAYKRNVWYFTVELAKEAVTLMGFNEIQFDYVRFPDRTYDAEKKGIINFQNDYNEEKAGAIQNFLRYATDEIHKVGAYVSADVFGESAHNYVTGYGQYWAAISNVVDVISAMPYPELFNKNEYGFKEPVWTVPYELLDFWAKTYVVKQQALIPTPAIVRTWIQAYDATWKSPKVEYNADMVSKQIAALYNNGLKGGFIAWNSQSSLSKYESLIPAFKKEY